MAPSNLEAFACVRRWRHVLGGCQSPLRSRTATADGGLIVGPIRPPKNPAGMFSCQPGVMRMSMLCGSRGAANLLVLCRETPCHCGIGWSVCQFVRGPICHCACYLCLCADVPMRERVCRITGCEV